MHLLMTETANDPSLQTTPCLERNSKTKCPTVSILEQYMHMNVYLKTIGVNKFPGFTVHSFREICKKHYIKLINVHRTNIHRIN